MGIEDNKKRVVEYFDRVQRGDPTVADMLSDDVVWWVPPGSDMGGTYEGKPKVLELMGSGVDSYSSDAPMRIEVQQLVAEGDWVCAQFILEAKTAAGRDYRNHYHFAFRFDGDKIVLAKEYVDTQYAHDLLFS